MNKKIRVAGSVAVKLIYLVVRDEENNENIKMWIYRRMGAYMRYRKEDRQKM